jgi:excisionase family DNA binding protein
MCSLTFYTVAEVADILKIHRSTVTEMIKKGDLAALKCGKEYRIPETALDPFLLNAPDTVLERLAKRVSILLEERILQRQATLYQRMANTATHAVNFEEAE